MIPLSFSSSFSALPAITSKAEKELQVAHQLWTQQITTRKSKQYTFPRYDRLFYTRFQGMICFIWTFIRLWLTLGNAWADNYLQMRIYPLNRKTWICKKTALTWQDNSIIWSSNIVKQNWREKDVPVGIQFLREDVRRDWPPKLVKMPMTMVLRPSVYVLLLGT